VQRQLTDGYELLGQVGKPCVMGQTDNEVFSSAPWGWDYGNSIVVDLFDPEASLSSAEELDVLNGLNALALQNQDGGWEIIQFVNAELLAPQRYLLTKLIRGQLGSEEEMR